MPEKVKTKIELLFQHRIERRCAEMHLTTEEEEKWNSKDSRKMMESDLSSSSEDVEECYSNDVNLQTDSSEEEDEDGNW